MEKRPQTDLERIAYRNAYYASRGAHDGHKDAQAKAYDAVRMERMRVVTSRRHQAAAPFTTEEWNYGCTPGQFKKRDEA